MWMTETGGEEFDAIVWSRAVGYMLIEGRDGSLLAADIPPSSFGLSSNVDPFVDEFWRFLAVAVATAVGRAVDLC